MADLERASLEVERDPPSRRLGEGPSGWKAVAADWPSIADIDDFDKIAILRQQKKEMKKKNN